MKTVDTLLVGFDFSNGADVGVLIVGRKRPNQSVDIINAFQGEEALWMYHRLIDKREKEESDGSEVPGELGFKD